jgi:hypothetical protein
MEVLLIMVGGVGSESQIPAPTRPIAAASFQASFFSAYEGTAGWRRRVSAFDRSPEHIVELIIINAVFLGEVHFGRFFSSRGAFRISIG